MYSNMNAFHFPKCSLVILLIMTLVKLPSAQSDVVGKLTVGYQAWFNCYGDGSPVESWRAWSDGVYQDPTVKPAPGFVSFDLYPDVSAYAEENLFATNLGNLADGQPAKLFSSYPEAVIDLHLQWMKEHGIDGLALQRFIGETYDFVFKINRDTIASRVQRAAERHGRTFYMMYDISGFSGSELDYLKNDWAETMIGELGITNSPAYARQDGKPVIAIWGIGFTHVNFTSTQAMELINWFKDNGYYVIGGVPTYWRTGDRDSRPGFEMVYRAFDMLSPWTVGRYVDIPSVNDFYTRMLVPDKNYCDNYGIDYQPVLFPGFAWSNWNGGPRNQIPRLQGDFFWRQAYNIRRAGINSAYVAMFDEYDESTAIMPMADSYLGVPTDQYFLTGSADGMYCSPDFYLRLTDEVGQLIRDEIPSAATFTTPHASEPFYFRTSLEPGYDALTTWTNTVDETTVLNNVSGEGPNGTPICAPTTDAAHAGTHALELRGEGGTGGSAHCYFKVFDVDIPVSENTQLRYWIHPNNENGRRIALDFIMTDGSNFRDLGASDTAGNGMHPGAGRGTVGQWTEVVSNIGQWLAGKTIDRILIAYDNNPGAGAFSAYVDDVQLIERAEDMTSATSAAAASEAFRLYPNPVRGATVTVEWSERMFPNGGALFLFDMMGRLQVRSPLRNSPQRLSLDALRPGVYVLMLGDGANFTSKRMVVLK